MRGTLLEQGLQLAFISMMNGANGVAAPPGLWSEARNAEGRVYYYNTVTKATQWTKPAELMTPAEVSIGGCLSVE